MEWTLGGYRVAFPSAQQQRAAEPAAPDAADPPGCATCGQATDPAERSWTKHDGRAVYLCRRCLPQALDLALGVLGYVKHHSLDRF